MLALWFRFRKWLLEEHSRARALVDMLSPLPATAFSLYLLSVFIEKKPIGFLEVSAGIIDLAALAFAALGLCRFLERKRPYAPRNIYSIGALPSSPPAYHGLYRYRPVSPLRMTPALVAARRSDIERYVLFSESVIAIMEAHDLDRRKLYEYWYNLNTKAFLALEVLGALGWRPIAVSILLPLTAAGYERFRAGRVSIETFERHDIEPDDVTPEIILIDTLIIRSRYRRRNDLYAFPALTIRHLAEYWQSEPDRWRVLVEPDDPKLEERVLKKALKFTGLPQRGSDGGERFGSLYEFDSAGVRYLPKVGVDEVRKFFQNVTRAANWPLYRG